jgi:hypothetical protein
MSDVSENLIFSNGWQRCGAKAFEDITTRSLYIFEFPFSRSYTYLIINQSVNATQAVIGSLWLLKKGHWRLSDVI